MEKRQEVLVAYVEFSDSQNPKNPSPVEIQEQLQTWINSYESIHNATSFCVNFLGEGYKHPSGDIGDIKFSVPYDRFWKFMVYFHRN